MKPPKNHREALQHTVSAIDMAAIAEAALYVHRKQGSLSYVAGEITQTIRAATTIEDGAQDFLTRSFKALGVDVPRSKPAISLLRDHRGQPEAWALTLDGEWGEAYHQFQQKLRSVTAAKSTPAR